MVRPLLDEGPPEAERQMAARLVTDFLATAAIEAGTASFWFSWAAPRQLGEGDGLDIQRRVSAGPQPGQPVVEVEVEDPILDPVEDSHHILVA